jgi:hypothetical protein
MSAPQVEKNTLAAVRDKAPPPRILRSALVEGILFFACAFGIDFVFFNGERYWNVSPHPFWLIVLLFSFQYGTFPALSVAVLSTLGLLWGNIPEQRIDQDYYEYLFHLSALPLSWGLVALVFGELRRRQLMENSRLRHDLDRAAAREDTLAAAYRNLSALNTRLETRIAARRHTIFTLFKAAQFVERLKMQEVLHGIEELVREVLDPYKFSFYLLQDDALELEFSFGWLEDEPLQRRLANDTALYRAMVSERRIVCIANPSDELILEEQGVLAGPVVHAGTGDVLGVIKIEDLGFLDLHLETIEHFRILCDWVGAAYAKAQNYEEAYLRIPDGAAPHLMPADTLEPLSIWLRQLAGRAKFNLWMLTIVCSPERQDPWNPACVSRSLLPHLRGTDLLFEPSEESQAIFVLLPATHADGVLSVVAKLTQAFHEEFPMLRGPSPIDIQVTRLSEDYEST